MTYKYANQDYCPVCEYSRIHWPTRGGLHGPCGGCGRVDGCINTNSKIEGKPAPKEAQEVIQPEDIWGYMM